MTDHIHIPRALLDQGLTPYQIALAVYYYSHGTNWESLRIIATNTAMSKTQAARARKLLIEQGHITEITTEEGKTGISVPILAVPHRDSSVPHRDSSVPHRDSSVPHRDSTRQDCPSQGQDPPLNNNRPTSINSNIIIKRNAILDFMGLEGSLNHNEPQDLSELLGWAWHIKLKSKETPNYNHVGAARAAWRKGRRPRKELRELATLWLASSDAERQLLLIHVHNQSRTGAYLTGPDYPHITHLPTLYEIYRELDPIAPEQFLPDTYADLFSGSPSPSTKASRSLHESPYAAIWKQVVQQLKLQMDPRTHTIFDATTLQIDNDAATLTVTNKRQLEWLEFRYKDKISEALTHILDRETQIPVYVTIEASASPPKQAAKET